MSPDGSRLVVRTYRDLFFYSVSPDGTVGQGPYASCPVFGIESQGEAVAWLGRDQVVLTSERGLMGRGTIIVVQCGTLTGSSR